MIIRFSAENFRSIRERQEFSFVASGLKDSAAQLTSPASLPVSLLRTAAIYGANASGKTNVLGALEFLASAVTNSQRNWAPEKQINIQPFRLSEKHSPTSSFEVEFLLNDARYRYGFRATTQEIVEEWLFAYPSGRKQTWFTRNSGRKYRFEFGKSLAGENRIIEGLTRPNSLFLSAAAQNNHELLLPIYTFFAEQIRLIRGRRDLELQQTMSLCSSPSVKKAVTTLLAKGDLGIVDIEVKEEPIDPKTMRVITMMWEALDDTSAKKDPPPATLPNVSFMHLGDSSPIRFAKEDESAGTLTYLALLGPVLSALSHGSILMVDELDASLHPLLAIELVKLFNNPMTNKKNAQLLFNTHDTHLLHNDILRRDQIWFTEKDKEGGTHLYPLTDFKPRKTENWERGYLEGRYGAIPFLGDLEAIDTEGSVNG